MNTSIATSTATVASAASIRAAAAAKAAEAAATVEAAAVEAAAVPNKAEAAAAEAATAAEATEAAAVEAATAAEATTADDTTAEAASTKVTKATVPDTTAPNVTAFTLTAPDIPIDVATTAATMTVGTVTTEARETSRVISTANKVNATTATKRKKNKHGEAVPAVKGKEVRIGKGVRVYSTKAQLKSHVKQGDPQYDIIKTHGEGFRFYGCIQESYNRKGWWVVAFDLFPTDGKSVAVPRVLLVTIPPGGDEPAYHHRNDKIAEAVANIEMLGSECDNNHCDILLADSDDDDDDLVEEGVGNGSHAQKKKKKKVSKKVESIRSFLSMSDDGVLDATTFDHYYGEGENDFIRWDILKEGEEIVDDVMQHPPNTSPFKIDIPWTASVNNTDYFGIFFEHFFPLLEGKAAVLDKYLSDERCSAYTYTQHDSDDDGSLDSNDSLLASFQSNSNINNMSEFRGAGKNGETRERVVPRRSMRGQSSANERRQTRPLRAASAS